MDAFEFGVLLLVVAGIMNASFTLPMKFTRRWAWENTWLVWSLVALVLLPSVVASCTLPDLASIYRASDGRTLWLVIVFGAGWGFAQVLFGLAVEAVGIALVFSLVLGTSAAMGALIPMLLLHPTKLSTAAGHSVLLGIAQMLLGVALCALAGRMRETASSADNRKRGKKAGTGMVLAIVCGCMASFQSFGLTFGSPLVKTAIQFGANPLSAANVVWLPLLMAGAIPNLAFCAFLLKRNSSASRFKDGGFGHWLWAFIMGIFWFGSLLFYGASVSRLGAFGSVLGWPLYMSLIVIAASLLGIATGEWKESGRWSLTIQLTGVATLVAAVFILARASQELA